LPLGVRKLMIYLSLPERTNRALKRTYRSNDPHERDLQFEAATLLFSMAKSGFERQHLMKRLNSQSQSA